MLKLIAFGDSFTWGSDMKDTFRYDLGERKENVDNDPNWYVNSYSRSTWQSLLASTYGFKYICHAREGCSNQSIVREFFRHAHTFKEGDLISVNFTWRDRYDFLNTDEMNPNYDYDDSTAWETVRPSGCESKYFELYYKNIQSAQWDIVESLKAINLIISYLKLNKHKFIITCIDKLIYDDPHHPIDIADTLRQQFKDDITWFDGKGFLDWSRDNNYPVSEMWHPLEEAHEAALKYMREIEKW